MRGLKWEACLLCNPSNLMPIYVFPDPWHVSHEYSVAKWDMELCDVGHSGVSGPIPAGIIYAFGFSNTPFTVISVRRRSRFPPCDF
jgi:hypothetical protein